MMITEITTQENCTEHRPPVLDVLIQGVDITDLKDRYNSDAMFRRCIASPSEHKNVFVGDDGFVY